MGQRGETDEADLGRWSPQAKSSSSPAAPPAWGKPCAGGSPPSGASVVVADIDAPRTAVVAEDIGALGVVTDVAEEAQVIRLVERHAG